MDSKINLKPYRQTLEAMIAKQTEVKTLALLSNAAANLDDPWLRDTLKQIIRSISIPNSQIVKGAKNISSMLFYVSNADEIISEVTEYVENIIDSNESYWEIIAERNGWIPPED